MKRYFLLYFIFCFPLIVSAQLKYNRIDTITILNNTDTLIYGLVGGLNAPQFNEIDLDLDGLNDLFIYEKDGGLIKTFINEGIPGESSYTYTTKYQNSFPELKNFVLLRDYNCDGKMDIFTGATGGLKVYKNTSIAGLGVQFELVTSLLLSNYNPNMLNLYVPSTDIPVIDDLDNDGDLDILTFGVVGTTVEHHENLSMDLYGTCDSLSYRLANTCWGNFAENSVDNGVTLGISCKGNSSSANTDEDRASRHSGSTLLTINLDGDSDKELILGDVSFNNLVMLTNGGDSITANMVNQMSTFPIPGSPVDISIFPAGFYLDINNDSVKDLIAAPTAKNVSENTESVWLYTNNNKTDQPSFSFTTSNFLQREMIEVGSGANPVFFDADADGLMDIVIGNYGYYNSGDGSFKGKLMLLKNTGTTNQPTYKITDSDYQSLSSLQLNGFYSAFGDMDNDGDEDMIVGDSNGELHYYENTAGQGNTATFSLSTSQYMDIDIGYFATPFIFDYNKDGVNDLLIGERAGTIKYFENTGTSIAANFSNSPTIDTLAGIDVMKLCCTGYSNVHAYFDNSNLLNLFVGSEKGIIYQYKSTDANLTDYSLIDSIITEGTRVNASLANIDSSSDLEIVSGHYTGGISIYSKTNNLSLIYPPNTETNLNDTLTLDWSPVESANYYQLFVDTTYNFNSTMLMDSIIPFINNSDGNIDTELTLNNLLDGETYFWKVRVISGTDSSDWTSVWQFTISETGDHISSVDNKVLSKIINIYPNPTSNNITIDFDSELNKVVLQLYNIHGQKVLTRYLSDKKSTIDLTYLPKGVYFGEIQFDSPEKQYFKIIKD